MEINKNNSKKKIIIIVIAVLFVLGFALTVYAVQSQNQPSTTTKAKEKINYGAATENEKAAGDSTKQQTIDAAVKDTPDQNDPTSSAVNITLTSANQNQDVVTIRADIGKVTTTGSCSLTMKSQQNGAVYSAEAGIQSLPSSSTCKGFDVPVSSLSSGEWDISIVFNDGNVSSKTTGTVKISV